MKGYEKGENEKMEIEEGKMEEIRKIGRKRRKMRRQEVIQEKKETGRI